jgi:hypothetical protein
LSRASEQADRKKKEAAELQKKQQENAAKMKPVNPAYLRRREEEINMRGEDSPTEPKSPTQNAISESFPNRLRSIRGDPNSVLSPMQYVLTC